MLCARVRRLTLGRCCYKSQAQEAQLSCLAALQSNHHNESGSLHARASQSSPSFVARMEIAVSSSVAAFGFYIGSGRRRALLAGGPLR
jgi:hypothetical protein